MVCVGNPPYERQIITPERQRARKGGWIRFGEHALLKDFLGGDGLHLKSLYNDYVYFWRWAVWLTFERRRELRSVADVALDDPQLRVVRQATAEIKRIVDGDVVALGQ